MVFGRRNILGNAANGVPGELLDGGGGMWDSVYSEFCIMIACVRSIWI
jgi:hypothetical protein